MQILKVLAGQFCDLSQMLWLSVVMNGYLLASHDERRDKNSLGLFLKTRAKVGVHLFFPLAVPALAPARCFKSTSILLLWLYFTIYFLSIRPIELNLRV